MQRSGQAARTSVAARGRSVSPRIRASCLGRLKRREPPAASRIAQGRSIIGRMRKEYASLRRRPLLAPVWLAALAAVFVVVLAIWLLASASTTTIMVMRHAEKSALPAEDPPLSVVGEARALALAQILGQAPEEFRVQAIFVSEFRRTQDTVRALASRLGVPVIQVAPPTPSWLPIARGTSTAAVAC